MVAYWTADQTVEPPILQLRHDSYQIHLKNTGYSRSRIALQCRIVRGHLINSCCKTDKFKNFSEAGSDRPFHNSLVDSTLQTSVNAPPSFVSEDTAPFDSSPVNGFVPPPFDESEEAPEKKEIAALSTQQDSKVIPLTYQELSFPSKAEMKPHFGSARISTVESLETEAEASVKEGDDFGSVLIKQPELLISQLLEVGGSENLKLVEELLEQDQTSASRSRRRNRDPDKTCLEDSLEALEEILAANDGSMRIGSIHDMNINLMKLILKTNTRHLRL